MCRLPLLCAIPFVGTGSVAGSSNVRAGTGIDEPIFGLYYNSREVHFGEIETRDLLPSCKKVLSDFSHIPRTLNLYAEYIGNSAKIYVAGRDDNDKILVIRNGFCDAGVPILAILQRHHDPRTTSDGPMLSDSEVTALFDDALARYAHAFGGKNQFFLWLDSLTEKARGGCVGQPESSCPPTYHLLQPGLQERLQAFRRQ